MFFIGFLNIIFGYPLHAKRKLPREPNSFFNLCCCFNLLLLVLYFIFTSWQMITSTRYLDIRNFINYTIISCGLYVIFISESWMFSDVVIWGLSGFKKKNNLGNSPNINGRYFSLGHIISCFVALVILAIIYGSK